MKKIFIAISIIIVVGGAGAYFWYQHKAVQREQANEAAVKNAVENFGSVLKNVSLLDPNAISEMDSTYKNYAAPALLAQWENNPSQAPGRLVSSPWPDSIQITAIQKIGNNSYEVDGDVIEMSSQNLATGGNSGEYPIKSTVGYVNNVWLITSFSGYPPPQAQAQGPVDYVDNQYGFSFALPQDWNGFTTTTSAWEGYTSGPTGDIPFATGTEILIRNPQWTSQNPYQDIPIMIFTPDQWDALLQNQFHIGAAPINPSLLGYNSSYIFALPARYNYAFLPGYQEVEQILSNNPLQILPQFSNISSDTKILVCGGISNGSTQNIPETTRLFINLPKNDFPDKNNNLQFKTVSGNATSTWISNAGPYGQAYQATANCWSYYYEFDGQGQIDLSAQNATTSQPNYLVHFIVGPTQ